MDREPLVKSQTVRQLDVWLIGPLMVWGGLKAGGALGLLLAGFGVSTVWYNLRNYRLIEAWQQGD